MTYKRSRARRAFETSVDISSNEALNLYLFNNSLNNIQHNSTRILGAYYVLIFAHLESYIKSVIEDAVDATNQNVSSPVDWPEPMLGYVIHQHFELHQKYKNFAHSENEAEVLNSVGAVGGSLLKPTAQNKFVLDASSILNKKKYPSPKNFPQLFRRIGIANIFQSISRKSHSDSRLILTSLNDLRSAIAHTGSVPSGFLAKDFKRSIRQMHLFVSALDKVLASHFCLMLPRVKWNQIVCDEQP